MVTLTQQPAWQFTTWQPSIWRAPNQLQIGLDASTAVVLTDVPKAVQQVVDAMDGTRTFEDLAALHPKLDPTWIHLLIRELQKANMIAPRPRAEARSDCVIVGSPSTLRTAVQTSIDSASSLRAVIHDAQNLKKPPSSRPAPRGAPPPVVLWSTVMPPPAPITLIVDGRVEADRHLAAELVRHQRPHLIVRTDPDHAVVGPLVLPGRSPCLTCTDLTRRQADPAWPLMIFQLSRLPHEPDPLAAAWAATTAATHVAAFTRGHIPDSVGATVELSARDGLVRLRTWRRHPECSCRRLEIKAG